MIIMGVDFGDARTGLAICDKGEMLASPVCVVSEKDFTQCQEKVAALAKEHRAELLVVGYPKNMNGTVGERAELPEIRRRSERNDRYSGCHVGRTLYNCFGAFLPECHKHQGKKAEGGSRCRCSYHHSGKLSGISEESGEFVT